MNIEIVQLIDGNLVFFEDDGGEPVVGFPIAKLFENSGEPEFQYFGVYLSRALQ